MKKLTKSSGSGVVSTLALKLSRRGFMQAAAAVSTAAVMAGCSSGDETDTVLEERDDLYFDKDAHTLSRS